MEHAEKYLADYHVRTEEESRFVLIPSSRKQYFVAILLLVGIIIAMVLIQQFNNLMALYAAIMSLLMIFSTPIVWQWVFRRFIKYNLVPAMNAYQENKEEKKLFEIVKSKVGKFLGIRLNPDWIYFIEAEPHDIDLTDNKVLLKHHAFDVTTTAIGFSFLFTMVLGFIINITAENWTILLYLSIGIAFISPLLISPLIPILWTLEDAALKSVDKIHQIQPLGFRMRERVFDRIIGKGGLIFGFSFVLRQITDINTEIETLSSFGQFLWTVVIFLGMVLIMALPCILTTMRYLRLYHEENVTLTRNILKTVIPIGYSVVRAESNPFKIFDE